MDYEPIKGVAEFAKEVDDFFQKEMKRAPKNWDDSPEDLATEEGWAFHRYMAHELGKRGWLCLSWPKKYGGGERNIFEQLAFNELKAYYRAPGIDSTGPGHAGPTILLFGTEEQKMKFLPPICRGEVTWCQFWSEPNAGSDLAALTTFARREGDNYIVNGQKIWSSHAHRDQLGLALFRTSRELTRSRGLTSMVVDVKSPGLTIRPLPTMSSHRQQQAYFNECFFDNVKVPIANRLGDENQGWVTTRATMNFERSGIGVYAEMRRSLVELIDFLKETKWRGRPLARDPLNRHRLAQLYIENEVGVASAYHLLWGQHKTYLGQGQPPDQSTRASSLKYFRSEMGQHFATIGGQILGPYSQLKAASKWAPLWGRLERQYLSFSGGNIGAGTTEIQKNIIAWEGLGLPRDQRPTSS